MSRPHSIERAWQSERPHLSLRALASLYTLGWRAYESTYRLGLKKRWRAPVPVVGVGSLWVGGVSKTPITIAIAKGLTERGLRVVVLTHGYGGTRYRQTTLIEPNEFPSATEVGDETLEIRTLLPDVPIAVGKWRVESARQAIARWNPDVLVLDDGFQHLPLARTLDLVALPASKPFGNGYCLPAGPLREPPDGLQRASAVLSVGGELSEPIGNCPAFEVTIQPSRLIDLRNNTESPLEALHERPVTLITGIARPERFIQTLQMLGAEIVSTHLYPDHHPFQARELQAFQGKRLVMTLKDAVKIRPLLPESLEAYTLTITATLSPDFWGWFLPKISGIKQESS